MTRLKNFPYSVVVRVHKPGRGRKIIVRRHKSYALAILDIVRMLKRGEIREAWVVDTQTRQRVGEKFRRGQNPFGLTQPQG